MFTSSGQQKVTFTLPAGDDTVFIDAISNDALIKKIPDYKPTNKIWFEDRINDTVCFVREYDPWVNQIDIVAIHGLNLFGYNILGADFHNMAFHTFNISHCDFLDELNLNECYFQNGIYGNPGAYNTFHENVNMELVETPNHIYFYNDTFKKDINIIYGSTKDISFIGCDIAKRLLVRNTDIHHKLDLRETSIGDVLDLRGLRTNDTSKILFENARLPDTILLSNIQDISFDIDLTTANFTEHKRHLISLYKTDISKIKIDYTHFKLLLVNTLKKEVEMDYFTWFGPPGTDSWSGKITDSNEYYAYYSNKRELFSGGVLPFDEVSSIYEALLKNFKDRGQMLSYELCDIEYRDYLWKHNSASIRWLGFVPKYWNNYGYDKSRVFYWMVGFILLFTVGTFFLGYDTLTREVYTFDTIPTIPYWKNIMTSPMKWKYLGMRFWYSFVYTASVFYLISLKVDRMRYHKKWAVFYLMLMYVVGIICLAYIANYIITR